MAVPVPSIDRHLLETPGDVLPRPHRNCYWLIPGVLLAGEHPGSEPGDCTARIDALLDVGMRSFVDLTEEDEGPEPYAHSLRDRAQARGLVAVHRRFAIRDYSVPSVALMRATLDAIYEAVTTKDPAYLHCWGGIGRTGTVVGCLLREQGLTAADAFAVIDRKWRSMEKRRQHPTSPESPEQLAFVEHWDRR